MRKPSPALLIALLALFVSLGGTGYAVSQLPKNSVGNKQLKKNAVTSTKVKDRSLLAKDFKQGQLPSGTNGAKGDTGPIGPGGPSAIAFSDPVGAGVALTTAYQVIAETPLASSSINPGALVLNHSSSVALTAVVDATNAIAAVEQVTCKIERNDGTGWVNVSNSFANHDIENGPSKDAMIATGGARLLPAGTHQFRVSCKASSAGAVTTGMNSNIEAVASE
jgi:hypothetical protein